MKACLSVWGALAVLSAPAYAQIDFSGGFGTGTGMQANGAATFTGNRARLTPATGSVAGSVFTTTQQDVRSFVTRFQFEFTPGSSPMADGLCFVLQRAGATAVGGTGGNLGYQGILTSVAVKFDIYDNTGSYTGIYTNGAAPMTPQTTLNPNLNFHNGNIFQADMTYDGTDLDVTITDMGAAGTTPGATASQTYPIDIPTVIGGTTAFAGFTAGTGGLTAIQEIVTWTYTNPPPAPVALIASDDQQNQVTLGWPSVAGATSYNVYRGTVSGGPYALIANVATNNYVDVVAPGQYYYVVTALGGGGESGNSPEDPGFSVFPPRLSGDNNEGILGDDCACGAAAEGVSWLGAWAAALALLGVRRR